MSDLLVTTAWLAEHINDPDLRVFDCTSAIVPDEHKGFMSASGRDKYDAGHIPGAAFLDVHADLSAATDTLSFVLPAAETFSAALSRAGVDADKRVVLYADANMWATRVWWLLRVYGFENVAVLDGGITKWQAEGRPLSQEPHTYPPSTFEATFNPALLATTEQVEAQMAAEGTCLVNALGAESFAGGHIPGSDNVPATSLFNEDSTFLPIPQLQAQLRAANVLDAEHLISYCGGGLAATVVAFALALAGRDDVRVYDGSFQAWTAPGTRPVTKLDAPQG